MINYRPRLSWLYLLESIFVVVSSSNCFCWTLARFSSHNSFPLVMYHRFPGWSYMFCFWATTSSFCFFRCSSLISGGMKTVLYSDVEFKSLEVFEMFVAESVPVKVTLTSRTFPSEAVPIRSVRYSSSIRQKLIELESWRRRRSRVSALNILRL